MSTNTPNKSNIKCLKHKKKTKNVKCYTYSQKLWETNKTHNNDLIIHKKPSIVYVSYTKSPRSIIWYRFSY